VKNIVSFTTGCMVRFTLRMYFTRYAQKLWMTCRHEKKRCALRSCKQTYEYTTCEPIVCQQPDHAVYPIPREHREISGLALFFNRYSLHDTRPHLARLDSRREPLPGPEDCHAHARKGKVEGMRREARRRRPAGFAWLCPLYRACAKENAPSGILVRR